MTLPRALSALLTASLAAAATADVGIVVLPRPAGFTGASANDISADGTTVVGSIGRAPGSVPDNIHAARWVLGQPPQDLGFIPGATGTRGLSVSANGQVFIGRAEAGSTPTYFRWQGAGPLVPLPVPAQTTFIAARAVSPDGSFTVGMRSGPSGTTAVRWQGWAAPQPLPMPNGATGSAATCVAPGGDIIGTALVGSQHLVRWTGDAPQVLAAAPSNAGFGAFAASADARTLVGAIIPNGPGFPYEQPFRWTADSGFEMLPRPAATRGAFVYDVSADGSIAVGISYPDAPLEPWIATVWIGSEVMTLGDYLSAAGVDVTGWRFIEARGISPDGMTIVGTATSPAGVQEAFVATIPAPGCIAALALGAGLVARRRR